MSASPKPHDLARRQLWFGMLILAVLAVGAMLGLAEPQLWWLVILVVAGLAAATLARGIWRRGRTDRRVAGGR